MPSSLLDQGSTYLIQHANQPVNWLTWSVDTLKKAQEQDKPILVSIGYAACHWCQEMSRNCFDDPYIASLMNRHFICILVDREENPELDHIYMEAVRMFDQSAGWPLHAFCLPDGSPFWGGTYFPKEDIGNGVAPWAQVLMRISEHYRNAKHELVENAKNVISNLLHSNHSEFSKDISWNNGLLGIATERLCAKHDDINGGFTPAPKFPSPMKIDFLGSMRETNYLRTRAEEFQRASFCINHTLNKISAGGIYDHVGGGFFRYSVDEKWSQPHYEKMLSDNALLLSTFSNAYRSQPEKSYKRIILGIISWLNNEMGKPQDGYASSLSAEADGIEGSFYKWSLQELEEILGEKNANEYFSSLPLVEDDSQYRLPQLINSSKISLDKQYRFLNLIREHRDRRPTPTIDNKKVLAHNSMVLSAFVHASIALNDISIFEDALKLHKLISKEFIKTDRNLKSFTYEGKIHESQANLDDYCFWIQALIDLSSITPTVSKLKSCPYLEQAIEFTDQLIEKFKDNDNPGFFFTDRKLNTPIPCRKKIWYDNATPSGNSVLLRIFSALHYLTDEKKWNDEFQELVSGYPSLCKKVPDGIMYALSGICDYANGLMSINLKNYNQMEILQLTSRIPYRPIFINSSKSEDKKLEVLINNRNVFSTDEEENLHLFIKES